MITPEQLNEVQQAYERAVETANTPTETYLDIAENKKIVQDFMLSEGLDQSRWNSEFIWGASIAECRKRGLLWTRPEPKNREQINAERDARLRADGSRQGNAHTHAENKPRHAQEEIDAAKQSFRDAIDPIGANRRRAAEKATADQNQAQEQRDLLASLPLDVDFPQMTKEQKSRFKRLSGDNLKVWMKKRAQWVRQNPPENTEAA